MKVLRACSQVVKLAWRVGPGALILSFGEVLGAVLRFLQPLVVAWLVNAIINRSVGAAVGAAVVFVAVLAASALFESFAVAARVRLIDQVGREFDREMIQAVSEVQLLDTLESDLVARAVKRVEDRANAMGYTYNALMAVLIQAAAPITSLVVAFIIDPRMLLLVLISIPAVWLASYSNARTARAEDAADRFVAQAKQWVSLLDDKNARVERSVYGLNDWYKTNLRRLVGGRESALRSASRAEAGLGLLGESIFVLGLAAIMSWLILWPSKEMTAGLVVAALLVGLDLRGALGALRFAFSGLGPGIRSAVALNDIRTDAQAAAQMDSMKRTPNGSTGSQAASCSYAYANGTVALREINLTLQPGSVVAVVGENGSGKTTLVELLLGLRKPSHGAVDLIAGAYAVLPQKFARPELKLSDAVAVGRSGGPSVVALEGVAVRDFWSALGGEESQLGSEWPGGVDLSGGQWQTVAAGRALYENARFLVLDEPTAALDPEAREYVSDRLLSAAGRVAEAGGTAVIVTHSMAIPHRADWIVVLHDGRVQEVGTHVDLIRSGGRYARSYARATEGFRGRLARE